MPTSGFFPLVILYANPCVVIHSLDGYSLMHYTTCVSSRGYPPSHLPPSYLSSLPSPSMSIPYCSSASVFCDPLYSLIFVDAFSSLSFSALLRSFLTRSSAAAGLYCLLELSPSLSYIGTTGNAMTLPFLIPILPGFARPDEETYRLSLNQTRRKNVKLSVTYAVGISVPFYVWKIWFAVQGVCSA